MGFFGTFDFNGDGFTDGAEMMMGIQMCASTREEAIELTGDDTFYMGSDTSDEEEDDDLEFELDLAGLDVDELAAISPSKRAQALDDAGLYPEDFEDFDESDGLGDYDDFDGGDFGDDF